MKPFQFISFLFMLFLVIFATNPLHAQKIKIKKKIVSIDKEPYCKTNCGGAFTQDCKIQNLDGETLVSLVMHDYQTGEAKNNIYEIIFIGTNYTAQKDASFSFIKKLIKEFYKYEVIKDGKLNEAGVQKFVKEYGEDLKSRYSDRERNYLGKSVIKQSSGEKKTVEHDLIERKRSANIMILGQEIQQDFKIIGQYEVETSMDGTTIQQNFTFSLPDGTLIATATMEEFSEDGACQVVTAKNNGEYSLSIKSKDKMGKAKEIAQFLVKQLYL
jgi:hypothetical protein